MCSHFIMALSLYSYPETLDFMNSEMFLFHEQSEVADALLGFCESFDGPHLPIDSLFDSPDDLAPVNANSSPLLPFSQSSLSEPSVLSLPPYPYPPYDEFILYPCLKRRGSGSDPHDPSSLMCETKSYEGPVIGPPAPTTRCMAPELLPDFGVPSPMMGSLQGCTIESKASNGCLSAQSVAARERRKRISEKTQELGRLIPEGTKVNTAEMLQAAFKYVKFLQAQVEILGLMGSMQGCSGLLQVDEELQAVLASPSILVKLSAEGRCIVPKEVVAALANDPEIKSNPFIFRDLACFIESMG